MVDWPKNFVVGTKENVAERDSFMTNNDACASSSSEMNFFTKRITSESECGPREDPCSMMRAKAAGTSAGHVFRLAG